MNATNIISHLFGDQAIQADDSPDAGVRAQAHRVERIFTGCVETLRSLELADLSDLGAYAWKVIEHEHCLTAIHAEVTTLTMAVIARDGVQQSVILIPPNWAVMAAEDPTRQLGAVTFVVSQAVDAYNGKLGQQDELRSRAVAYEGALLRMMEPSEPDDWQRRAMASEPPSAFAYERKDVVVP